MNNFERITSQSLWLRREGWFAGVCEGLGESFDVSPDLLRVLWLLSFFFFGFGFFVYIGLAIALPRAESVDQGLNDRFLGVCYRLQRRSGLDVGLIRFVALFLAVSSFGVAALVYLLLWLFLPEPHESF